MIFLNKVLLASTKQNIFFQMRKKVRFIKNRQGKILMKILASIMRLSKIRERLIIQYPPHKADLLKQVMEIGFSCKKSIVEITIEAIVYLQIQKTIKKSICKIYLKKRGQIIFIAHLLKQHQISTMSEAKTSKIRFPRNSCRHLASK